MAFQNTVTRLSELVADVINGAEIIGGTITGALMQTAEAGARWVISNGTGGLDPNVIASYSGDATETDPAKVYTFANGVGGGSLILESNTFGGSHAPARLSLNNNGPGGLNAATFDAAVLIGNGSFIKHLEIGVRALVFNASGQVIMSHSLGVVPNVVILTPQSGNVSTSPIIGVAPYSFASTGVGVHAMNQTAGTPYTSGLTVHYIVAQVQ